ncbi:MAG TPA: phosphotransferase family protein [Streptosporangiaceae bacterium]|jgi:aminoglycoside phosphotransferase (APT) family kinase protein
MGQTDSPHEPAGGQDPPGLDLAAFSTYFAGACPDAAGGGLRASVLAGGKSNITYDVTDGHRHWVVRRPPLGHVLATAHDMAREYRVISALAGTGVPVPATFLLCQDPGVIGAPFYVMEKVDGTPYRTAAQLKTLGAQRTRAVATRMIDTLSALHAVEPGAVGLADFGRPEGFLARQVRRWKQQLDASHSRDLPGADALHAALAERIPAESDVAIVHGDYRLDNLLIGAGDRITAVLDWEMATLGDPLTDVALLLAYQGLAHFETGYAVADAATAPGYPEPAEIADLYAERSGRDLSHLSFHLGLAYFKIAVICEGIYYRYTRGQTLGQGFGDIGAATEPLIQAGLAALKEGS